MFFGEFVFKFVIFFYILMDIVGELLLYLLGNIVWVVGVENLFEVIDCN